MANELVDFSQNYLSELEKDPKYSLEVDPENKYNLSDEQKQFIHLYVEHKNLATVAYMMDIKMDVAKSYLMSYYSQTEIRRINLAMYHRQFNTRMATLDELGGYLTSVLIDNVPEADRLKSNEKLRVIQLLIDLNKFKEESIKDPSVIMARDIDIQIKNLSVATIEKLLAQDKLQEKKDIVCEMTDNNISPEESAYLSSLSTDQLLDIIESTNGGESDGTEQTNMQDV